MAGDSVTTLALGAGQAGAARGRVVPAIAATLVVYAGLVFTVTGLLREHYLTPLVTRSPTGPGVDWIISQWWTRDGRVVFTGANPPLSLVNEGGWLLALSALLVAVTIGLVQHRAA